MDKKRKRKAILLLAFITDVSCLTNRSFYMRTLSLIFVIVVFVQYFPGLLVYSFSCLGPGEYNLPSSNVNNNPNACRKHAVFESATDRLLIPRRLADVSSDHLVVMCKGCLILLFVFVVLTLRL